MLETNDDRATVDVGDAEVAVREWGEPEGRPLFFWHGLNPFGSLQLNEVGPVWAGRGLRVLSIAAPGIADARTLSDLSGYRPTRLADLVVGLADELGIGRFVFVGWSWGASIGVHLAVRHTERLTALVLLDAGHTDIPGDPDRTLEDVLAELGEQHERYRFDCWDTFFAAAREARPRWRAALEEQLRAGMREEDGAIVPLADRRAAAAAMHGLQQQQPSSTHAALVSLEIPILLVLASRNDTAEEARRFEVAVPRAELVTIEGGHDLFADAPEDVAAVVADWLDGVEAR
jgi:pimeloyl-ACP methyl ester carboxylesterase